MNLVRYRIASQQLAEQRFGCVTGLVAWMGAVQAQDYAAAKWAVGQRLPASTDAELEQAFAAGALLRTHVMRPTWHFVAPVDIRWMLALTAPRIIALSAYCYRQLDLDAAFFVRSQNTIAKALEGGRHLTRQELVDVLQRAGLAKLDTLGVANRMGNIMQRAELDGVVCSGARRGKQFTYALLDERAPGTKARSRSEALAELCTRYFTSHGPAALRDFVWWSGLTVKDAREGLEMVKSKLISEVAGEQTYWMSPSISPARNNRRTAYLLPNFDEYLVAYADRRTICELELERGVDARNNLLSRHTILLDGKIVGTWRRSLGKACVMIEVKPFAPLNTIQARNITAAAERYGAFLGLEATVDCQIQ